MIEPSLDMGNETQATEDDATDNVRRLLGIPINPPQGRHSLPPSSTIPSMVPHTRSIVTSPNALPPSTYFTGAIPKRHTQSALSPWNMSAPRNEQGNADRVQIPHRFPFYTPPPPIVVNNDTNTLLSTIIEKLEQSSEETRRLRQEWTEYQIATAASRGVNPNNSSNRTSHSGYQEPRASSMSNEEVLEQRVSDLSEQIVTLTERLNAANLGYRNYSHSYRVPPHKWNIRFTKMTAESFIFQITSLKQSNSYEWNDVLACFHTFLEGNCLNWYWKFRSTIGDQFNWDTLSAAILTKYGNRKTDEEIWLQMAERKQGEREKFKDFYEAIEAIHSLCREPRADRALMRLIRINSKLAIQRVILTYEPDNLNDFIQKCDDSDQLLFPYLYKPSTQSSQNRRSDTVSSVELCDLSNEALSYKGCLNCGHPDHFVKQCDKPIQLSCFKCHKKGFTIRTCPDCNQNFHVSELKGEPPSQH